MTEQPNIVFILADQLRADFLSCYGAAFIRTPHIDSLCDGGVRYARAVSPSPLCVPARASLLTGLNAIKNGVLTNDQWLRPDREACGVRTWPELLTAAGYRTAAIGKMHFYPWDASEGFAERVIAEDKRHVRIEDDYYHYLQQHGHTKYRGAEHAGYFEHKGAVVSRIPAAHQVDGWVADRAADFIADHRESRPFALMVAFPGPHDPYDPPAELAGRFAPEDMPASIPATADSDASRERFLASYLQPWNGVDYREFSEPQKRKIRAHYAALVWQIDQGVGRVLAALERRGIADRTIVVFASDHGDFLGDFDRVGKSLFYESSLRVPLLVRHPRVRDEPVVRGTVSLTDLHATFLRWAGLAGGASPDSVPLPACGADTGARRAYVFGATGGGLLVTDDAWKLARYGDGAVMLFDLRKDPREQRNLAYRAEHAETLRRLDGIMQRELLAAIVAGHRDKTVVTHDQEPAFGRRGWRRAYPHPL